MWRAARLTMSNTKNNEKATEGGDMMPHTIIEEIKKTIPVIPATELIADALTELNSRVTEVETILNTPLEPAIDEYDITLESRIVALTDNQEAITEDLKTLSERLNGLIEALQDSVADL